MWSIESGTPQSHELELEIGRVLSGFAGGLHASVIKGQGAEFLGLRPYVHSDKFRQVDWMASARFSDDEVSLVSREYAPERQISVYILADESPTMSAPAKKAMFASALVRMFALSAFASDDPCTILGFNGQGGLVTSGAIVSEGALTAFLRATDRRELRRGLRPPEASLGALLGDIQLENALVVTISDLAQLETYPLEALRSLDVRQSNVQVVSIVLDEWSGFVPTAQMLSVRHPMSGKTTTMSMRAGGEFEQQVLAFHARMKQHRESGRSIGMRVIPLMLTHEKPLRQLVREWLRFEE